jgi:hypothetical protein
LKPARFRIRAIAVRSTKQSSTIRAVFIIFFFLG